MLCDYQLAVREHTKLYPTTAGILLFGKNPQQFFPQAYTVCTQFSRKILVHDNVIATQDFTGTIIEQFYKTYEYVGNQLSFSYVLKGPRRIDTPELPLVALREMIINAIVHRNYLVPSPIKIALFLDRIEIVSPGDFVGPITQHNLLMGLSFIRNNVICRILKEIGVIEAFGMGFTTLFQQYTKQRLPTPSIIEGENFIKCILPRQPMHIKKRLKTDTPFNNDTDIQQIIALFQRVTAITIKDVMENVQMARATAGRKLKQLVSQGVINKIGQGRRSHYVLSKHTN
jgi:ATP-dependent DNA helicase RecG